MWQLNKLMNVLDNIFGRAMRHRKELKNNLERVLYCKHSIKQEDSFSYALYVKRLKVKVTHETGPTGKEMHRNFQQVNIYFTSFDRS